MNHCEELPVKRQCELLELSRSSFYLRSAPVQSNEKDELLEQVLFDIHTSYPFYGYRKATCELRRYGVHASQWQVRTARNKLGIQAICPGPNTSASNKNHEKYPYLLADLDIVRPNQVWATDITYIRTWSGFMYLVAIVDIYSRRVLSHRLSNTLSARFCVDALREAIGKYGAPEIFNTDQGSQFTGEQWTSMLKAHGVRISMDGKGRALDNIYVERLWRSLKYEDIYLNDYESVSELRDGIARYFSFYNSLRFHQSLDYQTPDDVYFEGVRAAA